MPPLTCVLISFIQTGPSRYPHDATSSRRCARAKSNREDGITVKKANSTRGGEGKQRGYAVSSFAVLPSLESRQRDMYPLRDGIEAGQVQTGARKLRGYIPKPTNFAKKYTP